MPSDRRVAGTDGGPGVFHDSAIVNPPIQRSWNRDRTSTAASTSERGVIDDERDLGVSFSMTPAEHGRGAADAGTVPITISCRRTRSRRGARRVPDDTNRVARQRARSSRMRSSAFRIRCLDLRRVFLLRGNESEIDLSSLAAVANDSVTAPSGTGLARANARRMLCGAACIPPRRARSERRRNPHAVHTNDPKPLEAGLRGPCVLLLGAQVLCFMQARRSRAPAALRDRSRRRGTRPARSKRSKPLRRVQLGREGAEFFVATCSREQIAYSRVPIFTTCRSRGDASQFGPGKSGPGRFCSRDPASVSSSNNMTNVKPSRSACKPSVAARSRVEEIRSPAPAAFAKVGCG